MGQDLSLAAPGRQGLSQVFALVIAASVGSAAWWLSGHHDDGRLLAFSVLAGAAFGLVLQRSRFCFYCHARDFLEWRDARGLLAIVLALALGTLGYHAVFGAFLPIARAPSLPAGAHIGPISWVLALGALVFGIGTAISGSCISAHLYRLGEGAIGSVLALVGAMIGFALGFASWNPLYVSIIQSAPVAWLPHHLGYGGSLLLQLVVLGGIAALLLRWHRPPAAATGSSPVEPDNAKPRGLHAILFGARWPAHVGGIAVAAIGVIAYFRVAPLGVTAELGSVARTAAASQGWLPARLEGLDSFAGCATAVKQALLSRNGVFVGGLVLAAWASALASGDFRPVWPTWQASVRAVVGGVMMGWGAMVALGCTVGTLLSGIMAAAVSGWVFAIACGLGLTLGWWGRRRYG